MGIDADLDAVGSGGVTVVEAQRPGCAFRWTIDYDGNTIAAAVVDQTAIAITGCVRIISTAAADNEYGKDQALHAAKLNAVRPRRNSAARSAALSGAR
jgi:hypothetical protein